MHKEISEKINLTFRALRHRNYRLFFSGQCISLIGTWMQQIALSWLIYSLTKSALLMGIITFSASIPSLFFSPFAGVLIDRINKHYALITVQTMFMIEAFVLAILTILGIIQVWHIIAISILIGITNAFDMPLRQSFIVQLVDDNNDLSNAISLNSSSFNLARLIGPAVAGILIAAVGEGLCFLINAISYIAVIGALLAMKLNFKPINQVNEINILKELQEGVEYVLSVKPIYNSILFLAISSFIGMSYPVLMPIFAKEILNGGAQTLGFLMSASGIGALVGALHLAGKKTVLGLEKLIFIAALLFGLSILCLAFTTKTWISLMLLFVTGFGMVTIMASCNTLIQHWVDDDKRGRVMSLYAMAFVGTAPVGSLFGGAVAEKIGVPHTLLLTGLTMVIVTFIFSTKLKYSYKKEMEETKPIELNNETQVV